VIRKAGALGSPSNRARRSVENNSELDASHF
jgi:hypothetical protein